MQIYWSLKTVPELAALPSKVRRRVHESCFRRHFLHARATRYTIAAYVGFMACASLVAIVLGSMPRWLGLPYSWWHGVAALWTGLFVGWYVFTRAAIARLRPFYREFIERELHETVA